MEECPEAVDERDLADEGVDVPPGGGLDDVAAAEGAAPQGDPVAVDGVEVAGVVDGGEPVRAVAERVDQLVGALGVPEAAVVEEQGGDGTVDEPVGVRREPEVALGAEAVRHHDDRRRVLAVGQPEFGVDRAALAVELDGMDRHTAAWTALG